MGQRVELSLKEFINLIKSLVLGGYVHHYQTPSTPGKRYKQLPQGLSILFQKLDMVVNQDELGVLDPHEALDNFVGKLTYCSVANYFGGANSETNHAETLLAILLHHRIQLKIKGRRYLLSDMITDYLPSRYRYVISGGPPHSPSKPAYRFLCEQWRQEQHFPDLATLREIWQSELEKQRQAQRRSQQKEEQALKAQQERIEQIAQLKAIHTFEGMVLDLEKFSYALEGFVKTGRVSLGNVQQVVNPPQLCASVSNLMLRF